MVQEHDHETGKKYEMSLELRKVRESISTLDAKKLIPFVQSRAWEKIAFYLERLCELMEKEENND